MLARSCRQRAAARYSSTGTCVLARTIWYDTDDDVYERDGERSGWHQVIKKSSAQRYNDRFGTTFTSNDLLPDTDRTHVIPFATIESMVVDFLNGGLDEDLFDMAVEGLFPSAHTPNPVAALGVAKEEADWSATVWKKVDTARTALKKAFNSMNPSHATIVRKANTLVGLLNNSPDNVRVGVAAINRHISDNWDPVFKATPKGQHTVYSPRTEMMGWSYAAIGYEPTPLIENPHGSFLNPSMPPYTVPFFGSSQHASTYGMLPPPTKAPWQ